MSTFIQEIIAYKTMDGQIFHDKQSAEKHTITLKCDSKFNNLIKQQQTLEKLYEAYEWDFNKCNCHGYDNSQCLKHLRYNPYSVAMVTSICDCGRF